MDLGDLFKNVEDAFKIRRTVDFDKVSIVLETPSAEDETKVLEACSEFDGAAYVENLKIHSIAIAIRKINDVSFEDEMVEYPDDETGETKKMSRYLFLVPKVSKWPVALRDFLFNIFNNMADEVEDKVKKNTKFEMFKRPEQEIPEKDRDELKRIDVPDDTDMTDVERESKEILRQAEEAQREMDLSAGK